MPGCVTPKLALAVLLLLTACVELPQTTLDRAASEPDAARPVSAEAAAPASLAAPSPLRIGSWNVRKLGFEPGKDIASIAAVVERHFDLVALLEVVWSADDAAYEALRAALGPAWQLQRTRSARPNLKSPHAEYYVVALRSQRVAPCMDGLDGMDGAEGLEFLVDGEGSDDSPTRGLFLREPAFGCYQTRGPDAGNDFSLGVYHAEWGSGSADSIASEVSHVDLVFEAMRERFPQERQLFLIGDFNLSSAALTPLTSAHDRTRGTGSTLTADTQISANLYDHLLALGRASEDALLDDAKVLDVRSEAFDPKQFRTQVSDHLPLVAELRVSRDDD
jgi:hypothetical protein